MNLLNKLTIKNLRLNKKRTIVTVIGIMLSVALLTAVASIYASGIRSLINFETQTQGNYHVSYLNVDSNELNVFKNNRSIDVISVIKDEGYAKIDSQNEYKPYAIIKGFTKDSLNNLAVNIVSGRLPEKNDEIVIPTHLKTNGRNFLNVGDIITLDVGKRVSEDGLELNQFNEYMIDDDSKVHEKIIDTTKKTYKVVGITERLPRSVEPYSAPGYTFISYVDDKDINGIIDVYVKYTKEGTKHWTKVTANILGIDNNIIDLALDEKPKDEATEAKIEEEFSKSKYRFDMNSYLIGLETNPVTTSGIGGLGIILCIVLAIIVFTSVFCIKNSFDISITEKIKQYGMLRSIGATKKQIKKNVFYEATILGLIGIPLGLLLGCLASVILIIVSNFFLEGAIANDLKLVLSISPLSIVAAIVLGVITVYFSAFRSATRASKVSPIDSIRNSANIKISRKNVKSPKLVKKIFGMGGDISYKNLKRNKKKYRTTVISIVVSVFVFIALSSFMSMTFNEVEQQLGASDYNISLSGYGIQTAEEYNSLLSTTRLDDIEDYTILRTNPYIIDKIKYNKDYLTRIDSTEEELNSNHEVNYINLYAIGKEQYNKYIKSLGLSYDDVKDKFIIMDNVNVGMQSNNTNKNEYKNVRMFDYQVGDVITNSNNDKSYEVAYISDKAPFALSDIQDAYIIISDELFDKLLSSKTIDTLSIFYKSSNANKLQDNIDEVLKGYSNYRVNNEDENAKIVNNILTLVGIFLYGFIIVISLIGITNIFNTITTNMELRKQEFAMLKSVGMTTKEFNRMIRLESLFMGIKSLLFGLPIGIALSYLMYHFMVERTGEPYVLPIIPILISIAVVFVLISLIMKYSMSKINKQNTIETIRNENI
jgi:putative ABC transport system permease protein